MYSPIVPTQLEVIHALAFLATPAMDTLVQVGGS